MGHWHLVPCTTNGWLGVSSLPLPWHYHWPTVLLSMLAAIPASVVCPGRPEPTERKKKQNENGICVPERSPEVSLLGTGFYSCAAWHYIGMARPLRLPAVCPFVIFNSFLVVLVRRVASSDFSRGAALWDYLSLSDPGRVEGGEKTGGDQAGKKKS